MTDPKNAPDESEPGADETLDDDDDLPNLDGDPEEDEEDELFLLDYTVDDVRLYVEGQPEGEIVGEAENLCECLVARTIMSKRPEAKEVAVTYSGEVDIFLSAEKAEFCRMSRDLTDLAISFDNAFRAKEARREEVLAWMETRRANEQ